MSFRRSGWEPKSVTSYQLTVLPAGFAQKATLVCSRWAFPGWVFLHHAASASTNLSQSTLALLHIIYEHKPGRKGSLFSLLPRWAGAGNSLHPKPLPFLLLHTLKDASEAGWRGSKGHPADGKPAIFSPQQQAATCRVQTAGFGVLLHPKLVSVEERADQLRTNGSKGLRLSCFTYELRTVLHKTTNYSYLHQCCRI